MFCTVNSEGKYSFEYVYDGKTKYITDYIYDCMDVMSSTQVRVGRQAVDGKMRYGIICTKGWAEGFIVPCVFEKIKHYDDTDLMAIKDNKKYIITNDGGVKSMEIYELYQKFY